MTRMGHEIVGGNGGVGVRENGKSQRHCDYFGACSLAFIPSMCYECLAGF